METYRQYSTGNKVYHTGGPSGKVRTYGTSIPALSLLTLLDLTQFLWKVRKQVGNLKGRITSTKIILFRHIL